MAQPTTVVTPAYPYVEVEFAVGAFRSPIVLAYVDTGFDGYLIIPATQTSLLGPPQFFAPWELGDGSVVQAQEYRGAALRIEHKHSRPHYANRGRIPVGPWRCRPCAYDV
jgi:hypothetical protein